MSALPRDTGGGSPAPGAELDAVRAALTAPRSTNDAAGNASALAALFTRIEQQVAAERGVAARLRALPTRLRVTLALVCIALLVVLGALLGHGARGPSTALRAGFELALPIALLLVAVTTALRPLQRPTLPAWRARVADLVPYAVLLGLCFLPDLVGRDVTGASSGAWATALGSGACLGIGVVAATLTFAAVRLLDRGTPGSSLAAVGAGAVASYLTLSAICPTTAALHLLVGHYGAALVFAAAALALGAALRRSRLSRAERPAR